MELFKVRVCVSFWVKIRFDAKFSIFKKRNGHWLVNPATVDGIIRVLSVVAV